MLVGFFASTLHAQEHAPELLTASAHCLVIEKQDWLGLNESKAASVRLGYIVDAKSYPNEKHLFIVAYTGSREGKLFDIKIETSGAKQRFTIENNATFVHSPKGVSFVDPPLGGVWTTEHLQAAVKRIELESKQFVLFTKDLRSPQAQTECHSYADKQ
jgi:hypothetical protein